MTVPALLQTAHGREALGRLINDIAAVWPGDNSAACLDELVRRLIELRPGYAGLDVRAIGSAMRSVGIHTVNVRSGIHVRKGIRRRDLIGQAKTHSPGDHIVEAAIHDLFAALRYEGEWFLFDEPLVGFVRGLAAVDYEVQPARRKDLI